MAAGGGRSSADSWWPLPPGAPDSDRGSASGNDDDADSQKTLVLGQLHKRPSSNVKPKCGPVTAKRPAAALKRPAAAKKTLQAACGSRLFRAQDCQGEGHGPARLF